LPLGLTDSNEIKYSIIKDFVNHNYMKAQKLKIECQYGALGAFLTMLIGGKHGNCLEFIFSDEDDDQCWSCSLSTSGWKNGNKYAWIQIYSGNAGTYPNFPTKVLEGEVNVEEFAKVVLAACKSACKDFIKLDKNYNGEHSLVFPIEQLKMLEKSLSMYRKWQNIN